MTDSRSFRNQSPVDPRFDHPYKGPETRALNDIRVDIENGFTNLEGRVGDFPEVQWVDGGKLPKFGGDVVIRGDKLLQSQSFASLTVGSGTSEVAFTSVKPGTPGNDYTVSITQAGIGSVSVTFSGGALAIEADLASHSANDIATAVNASDSQAHGYIRCVSGGAGTSVPATSTTSLSGGTGEGWTCYVSGVEALPAHDTGTSPAAHVAEDVCTITVPDLSDQSTPRSVGDWAEIRVVSDGIVGCHHALVLVGHNEEPRIDWIDDSAGSLTATGGDIEIHGRNLLMDQEFASLTDGTGTSELVFTALKPGADGNDFTVEIDDDAAGTITKTGNDFLIKADISGGATADAVATIVNADGADSDGYLRCASGGAGAAAVLSSTNLSGGKGEGFVARVSGVEALPANTTGTSGAAAITDTKAVVTVVDLTSETPNRAANDPTAVEIESDSVYSNSFADVLS